MAAPEDSPAAHRSELVERLRLDRGSARGQRTRPRRARAALLAAAALAIALVGWRLFERSEAPIVRTAVARAATDGGAGGSVLDASGYVTARRQATVSAK